MLRGNEIYFERLSIKYIKKKMLIAGVHNNKNIRFLVKIKKNIMRLPIYYDQMKFMPHQKVMESPETE